MPADTRTRSKHGQTFHIMTIAMELSVKSISESETVDAFKYGLKDLLSSTYWH